MFDPSTLYRYSGSQWIVIHCIDPNIDPIDLIRFFGSIQYRIKYLKKIKQVVFLTMYLVYLGKKNTKLFT